MKYSSSLLEPQPSIAPKNMATPTQYPIMVIGGAEDKVNRRSILTAFFESTGGKKAKIGIIPCASQEPSVVGDRYHHLLSESKKFLQDNIPLLEKDLDDTLEATTISSKGSQMAIN